MARQIPVLVGPGGGFVGPGGGRVGPQGAIPPLSLSLTQLLHWPDRELIVLAELEPSLTLEGWAATVGTAQTYEVPLAPAFGINEVAGGVYRRVIGVREEATDLTERTSIATVDATAGSWFWDPEAAILYVHATDGESPDTFNAYQAFVRLHMATTGIVLDGVYHHPWISLDTEATVEHLASDLFGVRSNPTARLVATNGHGIFHKILAPNSEWNWKNKRVRLLLGGIARGVTLPRDRYEPISTLHVEDASADEVQAIWQLAPRGRQLDVTIPITPLFDTEFPNIGEDARGQRKPIGYGRTTMVPLLVDTAASQGKYLIADAAFQALHAIHTVWARTKESGARTLLTLTTDYTIDLTACTVTVVNAAFAHATHTLEVDVTGKPKGGQPIATFSGIVEDLLRTFAGATDADLNLAAFARAVTDAPQVLSVWLLTPRTINSILRSAEADQPSLEASVFGAVGETRDGTWTAQIRSAIDPTRPAWTLQQSQFREFVPQPILGSIFPTALVFYARNHARDTWSVQEATDDRARFVLETDDHVELFTFLRDATDAQVHAQLYQKLAGAPRTTIRFAEKAGALARARVADVARVSYAPALDAAGALVDESFELTEVVKSYVPTLEVSGVLRDLRALGGKDWVWSGDDAPATWAAASPAQRRILGFWAGDDGRIDPADAATANLKTWR